MIKRFTLSIIILALSVACSFSATFYASTTGSNTAPYDTLAKGATSIQTAISAITADGDIVIVDDEVWVLTGLLSDASVGLAGNGSFTIQSLSNNPLTCSIDSNHATRQLFFMSEATHTYNWKIKGFKLTNSVAFTQAGGGAIFRNSGTSGNVTFDNCRFEDITFAITSASFSPLIRNDVATSTLTMADCVLNNIASASSGAAAADGFISVNGDVVISDLTLTNITKNQNANNQASLGIIYAKEAITIDGLAIDNITMTCPDGSNGNHPGIIYCSDTAKTATISNVNCLDSDASGNTLTKTGGSHVGGVLTFLGPYSASNIVVEKAVVTEEVTNGLGCAVTATGSTAVGTVDNLTVRDCTAQHGVAIYMSQGAEAVVTNLLAHDNTAVGRAGVEAGAGGAAYFGGDGDSELHYCLMYNNTADEGGAVYAHQQGSPTRAKFTNIYNCVMYGNTATGGDGGTAVHGAFFRGDLTFPHTVDVINTISWNGGTLEMQATADATVVFTVDHSNVEGGAAAVVGEDTYTNNIALDPLFIDAFNNDFHLNGGSPCLDAGVDVGLSIDFDGNPVVIPFIGAYGFGYDLSRILSIGNIQRLSNQLDLNQHTQGLK